MENSEQTVKKASKYASQIAYDKHRKQVDPEYKAKRNAQVVACLKKRLENDPEYRERKRQYMKEYMTKVRENHRQFVLLQKMQSVQLKDKLE